jgi:hypothetical protein
MFGSEADLQSKRVAGGCLADDAAIFGFLTQKSELLFGR